jgi:glycosyltransferase involved in cell wall biosynthesis
MLPQVSILILYRNRAIPLVERCLQALAQQTRQDFVVIFLDYGSDVVQSKEAKNLTQKFPFVQYHYAETRGWFWNRAQALNLGIQLIKTEFYFCLDVDLIIPPDCLQNLLAQYQAQKALVLRCHYLPATFKDYAHLHQPPHKFKHLPDLSSEDAQGNIFLQLADLQAVGGYDEFYRWWGREDNDLAMLLNSRGVQVKVCELENQPVFHQWHPPSNEKMPKGWQKIYEQHYQTKKHAVEIDKKLISNQATHNQWITLNQRPALQLFLSQKLAPEKAFIVEFPKEATWVKFQNRFFQLHSGDYLWIKQDFSGLKFDAQSRLGNWVTRINKLLDKSSFSYRLIDLTTYFTENIDVFEVRDFIFYFVLYNQAHLADYYFQQNEQTIDFVLVRK